jgi:hypothetical protein
VQLHCNGPTGKVSRIMVLILGVHPDCRAPGCMDGFIHAAV